MKQANGTLKRRIETFQPTGPIACMIDNATRRKPKGAKTRFFEDCIAEAVGHRFPKLLRRFKLLRKEAA